MTTTVPCPNCTGINTCPRCAYLINNMSRWHKVALAEHMKHCTQRHDHNNAVEAAYLNTPGERG
jgi:hypothetical protein